MQFCTSKTTHISKNLRSGLEMKERELAKPQSKEANFALTFRCTELSKASTWGLHLVSYSTKLPNSEGLSKSIGSKRLLKKSGWQGLANESIFKKNPFQSQQVLLTRVLYAGVAQW